MSSTLGRGRRGGNRWATDRTIFNNRTVGLEQARASFPPIANRGPEATVDGQARMDNYVGETGFPGSLLKSPEGPNVGTCITPTLGLPDAFLADVRAFREFGTPTQELTEGGIPYLINEFWTARQRQSHHIHEISYRACFKAQLPEFFVRRLTQLGEAVHDPFMGRGTTLVQAALMGRKPVGNDINPLSILLTRPRLTPPSSAQVAEQLRAIPWGTGEIDREDLLVFYHPDTLRKICALRRWLLARAPLDMTNPDPVDDWIRMVAINRLTGHSTGFFSIYTLPPNQAVSIEGQLKINGKRKQSPPSRDVVAIINKKTETLLADGGVPAHPPALLGIGLAHQSSYIPDSSVSLVVTSPPFLDIVQYAADNWLRCWFAGIDVDSVAIAMHRPLGRPWSATP